MHLDSFAFYDFQLNKRQFYIFRHWRFLNNSVEISSRLVLVNPMLFIFSWTKYIITPLIIGFILQFCALQWWMQCYCSYHVNKRMSHKRNQSCIIHIKFWNSENVLPCMFDLQPQSHTHTTVCWFCLSCTTTTNNLLI